MSETSIRSVWIGRNQVVSARQEERHTKIRAGGRQAGIGQAGRQALQEQNYSRLLADVTKSVIEVNEPEMASEALARAFHIAESGTPGPVAIILPEDIFGETTDAPLDQPRPRAYAGARPEDVEQLAAMLSAAAIALRRSQW